MHTTTNTIPTQNSTGGSPLITLYPKLITCTVSTQPRLQQMHIVWSIPRGTNLGLTFNLLSATSRSSFSLPLLFAFVPGPSLSRVDPPGLHGRHLLRSSILCLRKKPHSASAIDQQPPVCSSPSMSPLACLSVCLRPSPVTPLDPSRV